MNEYKNKMSEGEALKFLEEKEGWPTFEAHQFLHEPSAIERKHIFQKVMDRKRGLEYA